jgi:hypothetical protein
MLLAPPPPATVPTFRIHELPALLFGAHTQPVPVNDVFAGTVSVIVTLLAPILPLFV